jgi:PAS domain S-box-containing protein
MTVPKEIIAVPLTIKNQVVAILELASRHGFSETEMRIITRIAPALGIAINSIKSGLALMALLEERNRIFNLSLDMICVSGFDGYFKQLNPAWEKTLGWSSTELMNKPILDLVHPKERKAFAGTAESLASGQALVNYEARYLCLDGSYTWMSFNSYPLVEEELVFSIARDVTAQKMLEQDITDRSLQLETTNHELHIINEESQTLNRELQILNERLTAHQIETARSNQLLEKALKAKSDFLANMSHELRTPLNSVIGFSEVLQDQLCGPINQKQLDYVNNINTSGKRLLTIINDILDLSKAESGALELQLSAFSLRECLESSLLMFREKADKRLIKLRVDLAHEADIRIEADLGMLKQIMFNLLSNAVKFTPDGGRVDVSALRLGDFIEISIKDTGIGIKPDQIPKLFQAFNQLESVYTKTYQGAGLGLALTRQLVELHGGIIRVESQFEAGSRFSFTIPFRNSGEMS